MVGGEKSLKLNNSLTPYHISMVTKHLLAEILSQGQISEGPTTPETRTRTICVFAQPNQMVRPTLIK